jgi:hypothetical protein
LIFVLRLQLFLPWLCVGRPSGSVEGIQENLAVKKWGGLCMTIFVYLLYPSGPGILNPIGRSDITGLRKLRAKLMPSLPKSFKRGL